MRKVNLAAAVLQQRIEKADHLLQGLPSERRLADELGMSRCTVREALRQLVEQGVLVRQRNRRLALAKSIEKKLTRTLGLLMPPSASSDRDLWREALQRTLAERGAALRPVTYAHWGDPSLADALAAFDRLFLLPIDDRLPRWLADRLRNDRRAVVLDQDESPLGLPSVQLFPAGAERKLLERLAQLGHRRIDCLNTAGHDAVIRGRIDNWQAFLRERGLDGTLHERCVQWPLESAYHLVRQHLAGGGTLGSALFCTTAPCAVAAMRALYEAGLEVGRDVSVCTVNDEGFGRFMRDSLTSLDPPSREEYLQKAVDWVLGEGPWKGPLLIRPGDLPIYEGESTGPAPADPIVRARPDGPHRRPAAGDTRRDDPTPLVRHPHPAPGQGL